jgi:hypothetical protein
MKELRQATISSAKISSVTTQFFSTHTKTNKLDELARKFTLSSLAN